MPEMGCSWARDGWASARADNALGRSGKTDEGVKLLAACIEEEAVKESKDEQDGITLTQTTNEDEEVAELFDGGTLPETWPY